MSRLLIVYATHNRLEYVKMTLPQVIEEAKNCGLKPYVYIGDDNSTDGTEEYIKTVKGVDKIETFKAGNSTFALNRALRIAEEIGAEYVYKVDNDILLADGQIKKMVKLMDKYLDACSIMVEEALNLPFINPAITVNEHIFTSSLGIHRVEAYPFNMVGNKRYFGFSQYQSKILKQGWACYRVKGIGNTNLDQSPWSRQMDHLEKGFSRTGLVGNEKSVYINEQLANEKAKK